MYSRYSRIEQYLIWCAIIQHCNIMNIPTAIIKLRLLNLTNPPDLVKVQAVSSFKAILTHELEPSIKRVLEWSIDGQFSPAEAILN